MAWRDILDLGFSAGINLLMVWRYQMPCEFFFGVPEQRFHRWSSSILFLSSRIVLSIHASSKSLRRLAAITATQWSLGLNVMAFQSSLVLANATSSLMLSHPAHVDECSYRVMKAEGAEVCLVQNLLETRFLWLAYGLALIALIRSNCLWLQRGTSTRRPRIILLPIPMQYR